MKNKKMWAVRLDWKNKKVKKWILNYQSYNIKERLFNFADGEVNLINEKNIWIENFFNTTFGVEKDNNFIWFVALENTMNTAKSHANLYSIKTSNYSFETKKTTLNLCGVLESGNNRLNFLDFPMWNNFTPTTESFNADTTYVKTQKTPSEFIDEVFTEFTHLNVDPFVLEQITTADKNNTLYNSKLSIPFDFKYANKKFSDVFWSFQKRHNLTLTPKLDKTNDKIVFLIRPLQVNKFPINKNKKGYIFKTSNIKTNKESHRYLFKHEDTKRVNKKIQWLNVNDDTGSNVREGFFGNFIKNKPPFMQIDTSPMTEDQLAAGNNIATYSNKDIDNIQDDINLTVENADDKHLIGDFITITVGGKSIQVPIFQITYSNNTEYDEIGIGRNYNTLKKTFKQLMEAK